MNGRVYDYNLGRFMSVDPFVHDGSQGLNPYSYILNNPLSGIDPSGYSPEVETKQQRILVQDVGSKIKRSVGTVTTSTSTDGNTVTTVTKVELDSGHTITQHQISVDGEITYSQATHTDLNSKPREVPPGEGRRHPQEMPDHLFPAGSCVRAGCLIDRPDPMDTRSIAEIDQALDELGENVQIATGILSLPMLVRAVAKKLIRRSTEEVQESVRRQPTIGGGGTLDRLTPSELTRIENAADRIGQDIHVVGSRVNPNKPLRTDSDYDYVIEANAHTRNSASSSLPGAKSVRDNTSSNNDVFKGPLQTDLPHVTVHPKD